MSKPIILGYVISLTGMAIWLYGYLAAGNPSLIDWRSNAPWWIADYLPNIESEMGLLLAFGGMIPIYWPRRS